MVKYIVIIMVLWLILSICFSYMTYLIGYTKGFNKCKRIDDEILDKYSKERAEEVMDMQEKYLYGPVNIDEELDKYKKTIEFMKKIGI